MWRGARPVFTGGPRDHLQHEPDVVDAGAQASGGLAGSHSLVDDQFSDPARVHACRVPAGQGEVRAHAGRGFPGEGFVDVQAGEQAPGMGVQGSAQRRGQQVSEVRITASLPGGPGSQVMPQVSEVGSGQQLIDVPSRVGQLSSQARMRLCLNPFEGNPR